MSTVLRPQNLATTHTQQYTTYKSNYTHLCANEGHTKTIFIILITLSVGNLWEWYDMTTLRFFRQPSTSPSSYLLLMLRRGVQLVLRRGGRPLLRLEVWLGMWLRVSRYLWLQWWEVLG